MKKELLDELSKVLEGEVSQNEEILNEHARDASLFEVKPDLVVFPKNSKDVEAIVKFVSAKKDQHPNLSITPRSAGTCMVGGSLTESISLDVTKYMNGLGELNIKEKFLHTQPGAFYRDFEEKTLEKGLIYPAFPASKSICAMGGIVGNNGAGEKTLRYGKAEDYVKSLQVVFSDGREYEVLPLSKIKLNEKMSQDNFEGNLYAKLFTLIEENYDQIKNAKPQVSKNSAGYYLWNVWDRETKIFDLTKLLVGSQGTLGVITDIKMGLVDVPKEKKLVAMFVKNLDYLGEIVNEALTLEPESIEAYDDKTIKLALKFWFGFFKKRGFLGAIKLGFQMIPELFMLARGLPKIVLLVNFTANNNSEVIQKALELNEKVSKYPGLKTRITNSDTDAEKYWTIRHDSFALLQENFKNKRTAPFIDDVIVKPEYLPKFLPEIKKILDDAGIFYNIHGHAGDGNFHLIPLLEKNDKFGADFILDLSNKIYEVVIKYKGSITAEHNDGIIRTPYLPLMYGDEIVNLFQKTKNIFDPQNIFNPGKKVGGTFADVKKYLKKDE